MNFDWTKRRGESKKNTKKQNKNWLVQSVRMQQCCTYQGATRLGATSAAANEANGEAATSTTTTTTNTTTNYRKVPKLNYAKHVQKLFNLIA